MGRVVANSLEIGLALDLPIVSIFPAQHTPTTQVVWAISMMRVGVVNTYTIGAPSLSRKRASCLTEHTLQAACSFRVTHSAERAVHPRVQRLHKQTLLHSIRCQIVLLVLSLSQYLVLSLKLSFCVSNFNNPDITSSNINHRLQLVPSLRVTHEQP